MRRRASNTQKDTCAIQENNRKRSRRSRRERDGVGKLMRTERQAAQLRDWTARHDENVVRSPALSQI
jgi:hypothetical protein